MLAIQKYSETEKHSADGKIFEVVGRKLCLQYTWQLLSCAFADQ